MPGTSNSFAGPWLATSGCASGSGHVERSIPCQDRADAWTSGRPGLMVLDGRGSAEMSHVGAAAAQNALRDFILDSEPTLERILDNQDEALAAVGWQGLARMIFHRAACEQLKLAGWYQMPARNFEFTLTLVLVGARHVGWLAVGDSPLVIRRNGICGLASVLTQYEFVNQTTFVTATPSTQLGMQGGIFSTDGLGSLVAMSDGTASRLLSIREQVPAGAISQIIDRILAKEWNTDDLIALLVDPDWDRITRDDRSLAILTRSLPDPLLKNRAPHIETKLIVTSRKPIRVKRNRLNSKRVGTSRKATIAQCRI